MVKVNKTLRRTLDVALLLVGVIAALGTSADASDAWNADTYKSDKFWSSPGKSEKELLESWVRDANKLASTDTETRTLILQAFPYLNLPTKDAQMFTIPDKVYFANSEKITVTETWKSITGDAIFSIL